MAGTSDGNVLAAAIQEKGLPVLVTVTSAYGETLALENGLKVHAGPLNGDALFQLIEKNDVKLLVDATHPYAMQASVTAMEASRRAGISCYRYERPLSAIVEPFIHSFSTIEELCTRVEQEPGNVLLTLGSNQLQKFSGLKNQDHLYIRMLPVPALIEKCLELGFRADHIVGMQGPFSTEFNCALIRQWDISVIVTKDSAAPGGFAEKLEAARQTGIRLFLLSRPEITYSMVYTSVEPLLESIAEEYRR